MDAIAFCASLQSLATLSDVSRKLSSFGAAFGFPTHVMSPIPTEDRPVGDGGFLVQNWPDSWHETYVSQGFARFDPVPRAAAQISLPMTIAEIYAGLAGFQPEPGSERILEAASALGRHHGLLVPVFGPGGYRGIVCYAGQAPNPDATARTALHMAALYAHERVRSLARDRQRDAVGLSERELAVLQVASQGCTDLESAETLGISVRTVRFHFGNVRRKLGAANRQQAVAEAAALGLLAR